MPVEMKPTSVIIARLGLEPNGKIQKFFTETCYKAMNKYVPRSAGSDGGNLRENVNLGYNTIVYESPYARYQYYGMREDGTHVVKNYTTPGTGTYWDKKMWSAEKNKVIREVQKEIEHGG